MSNIRRFILKVIKSNMYNSTSQTPFGLRSVLRSKEYSLVCLEYSLLFFAVKHSVNFNTSNSSKYYGAPKMTINACPRTHFKREN